MSRLKSTHITRVIIGLLGLAALCAVAEASTFDQLLGNFRQRRSGVCVIYAHTLAVAEQDPNGFANLFNEVPNGWRVQLANDQAAYVTRKDVQVSLSNSFSAGEPDNLMTVYSIAVSKKTGGFNYKNGQLDYGPENYAGFIGSGKWTLYDDGQGPGHKLADGLDRLTRETTADGRPSTPSTVGFGALNRKSTPEFVDLVKKYRLIGIHDFSVSRYDSSTKEVLLRNPHNPAKVMRVPMDLLRKIPAGIDFMEPAG